jgi:transposase-like protein
MEKKRWGGSPAARPVVKFSLSSDRGGYYRCPICRLVFTVRNGTIMERSHIPLDKWLYAFYRVLTARKGISSLQLAKEIGITQKSVWFLLQRIREACGKKDDENQDGFLQGIVEADETCIGSKEANKHEYKKLNAGRGMERISERTSEIRSCSNCGFGKTGVKGRDERKVRALDIEYQRTALCAVIIRESQKGGISIDEESSCRQRRARIAPLLRSLLGAVRSGAKRG